MPERLSTNEFPSGPLPYIDASKNIVPQDYTRGANSMVVLLWIIIQNSIFNWAPRPLYGWRRFWLKIFGAKLGKNVRIRPGVIVEFPWRLTIGENSSIGDFAWIYNLAPINIGKNCTVSQYAKLATGSHDVQSSNLTLKVGSIHIGDGAWIGANSFVGPGVQVGEGAVLGACSVTFRALMPWTINVGNPAKYLKDRIIIR